MSMDYPANSQGSKRPPAKTDPKKVERVTVSAASRRKKPLRKRLSEAFVGGDARGVGSFVVLDILLPAAKDMIADAFSLGVERMIYGESRSASRRGPGRYGAGQGFTAYHRPGAPSYGMMGRPEPRGPSRQARATHNFDEIVLPTRAECEEVITQLFERLEAYQFVSVRDLYEMVGITPDYTDEKYGWDDLYGADFTRIRDGYVLDLPRPIPFS